MNIEYFMRMGKRLVLQNQKQMMSLPRSHLEN